jgi:dihydroorotase
MTSDVLISGGTVIDPSQGISEKKDVAVERGRVASIENHISHGSAGKVIDAKGLLVTPGLIDLHSHVARTVTRLSVDADDVGLARGSTTMVDAGSTGELLFPAFRKHVIESARCRILAFLNVESLGMVEFIQREPTDSDQEWSDLITTRNSAYASKFVNLENSLKIIRSNRDVIVGIKWAHHGLKLLKLARKLAGLARLPVMAENYFLPDLLKYLRRGDVITHFYHRNRNILGKQDGISSDGKHIIPEAHRAGRKGLLLDVGHGRGSFSWSLAEIAFKESLVPDVISTDLWIGNVNGPVYDLPTTMSKLLHLGMSLEETVRATTLTPASVLKRDQDLGTLKFGAPADIALLRLHEEPVSLPDSYGASRRVSKTLRPVMTFRGGKLV